MIQPLELHKMNVLEFYEKLRMSNNDFERWMTNLGLLHSSMLCDNCHQPMIDRMQERNRCWNCDHTDCRFGPTNQNKPTKGFLTGTFFTHKKTRRVPFKLRMLLSYLWTHRMCTLEEAVFETKMKLQTILRCWSQFRRLCVSYFRRHPTRLEGPRNEVEIDKMFLTTRKVFYNFWVQVAELYPCN